MDNITEILLSFSDKYDLWTLTQKSAIECITNYIKEGGATENSKLNYQTYKNVILNAKKQELVFWYYEKKTFILRTTFAVSIDGDNGALAIGEYSLDVNSEGEIIDDWLIIN